MHTQILNRYLRREEGATIIEYAIVAPVLFLMVMAIVEFSLIMYAQSVLDSATTQAARFGTTGSNYVGEFVNPSGAGAITDSEAFVESHIRQRASGLLNEDNINIARTRVGQSSLYDVSLRWELFTPFIREFFTSTQCGAAATAGEAGVYNICSSAFVTDEV